MKKVFLFILVMSIGVFSLAGCTSSESSSDNTAETNTEETNTEESTPVLEKITAAEAKEMMDESEDVIILDVRSQEEYDSGHIEGAILIPDTEIITKAEDLLKDKSEIILVYCRSGRRSALAAQDLSDLGYTSIYDFGGIIDWPYDTVVE